MKTFCPNCEKETECEFQAELYYCDECEGDFASYEKPAEKELLECMKIAHQRTDTLKFTNNYWHKVATKTVNQRNKLSSFLQKIMMLGLLRGSERLTKEALDILDDIGKSDIDVSDTQNIFYNDADIDNENSMDVK